MQDWPSPYFLTVSFSHLTLLPFLKLWRNGNPRGWAQTLPTAYLITALRPVTWEEIPKLTSSEYTISYSKKCVIISHNLFYKHPGGKLALLSSLGFLKGYLSRVLICSHLVSKFRLCLLSVQHLKHLTAYHIQVPQKIGLLSSIPLRGTVSTSISEKN